MNNNVFYIPILCCGQEMSDVLVDGRRISAICQICGKEWKPKQSNEISFTKTAFKVKIDPELQAIFDSDPEAEGRLKAYVSDGMDKALQAALQKEINELLKESEGGYDLSAKPIPLWTIFELEHPSMWVRTPKPKNHYERMMARRRK